MKRLRSWSILDTRTGDAKDYEVAVIRRKDGALALVKFWERDGKKYCSTYHAMPNTPPDRVLGMAQTLLKHLEARGCAVHKRTKTRS